eukprot:2446493-Prymnesium_polylepis.2
MAKVHHRGKEPTSEGTRTHLQLHCILVSTLRGDGEAMGEARRAKGLSEIVLRPLACRAAAIHQHGCLDAS